MWEVETQKIMKLMLLQDVTTEMPDHFGGFFYAHIQNSYFFSFTVKCLFLGTEVRESRDHM